MLGPKFYLGEGEFTRAGEISRDIARQIKGRYLVEGIDEFVRSLRYEKREDLWRERTAEQIIDDYFLTGCTDAGLVFVTLARIKGIPAAYVETVIVVQENILDIIFLDSL